MCTVDDTWGRERGGLAKGLHRFITKFPAFCEILFKFLDFVLQHLDVLLDVALALLLALGQLTPHPTTNTAKYHFMRFEFENNLRSIYKIQNFLETSESGV